MRFRWMLASVMVAAGILPACTNGSGSLSPPSTTPVASASIVRAETRAVAVSLRGIRGETGGQLAGILFIGHRTSFPDFRPIGGFATTVDADPFSTTQIVREPSPTSDTGEPFPFVTNAVLRVLPGTYTIALYAGPRVRPIPYSHWRPFGMPGLMGCRTTFVVEDGEGRMVVRIHPALMGWSGNRDDRWGPWHEHPPSCAGS